LILPEIQVWYKEFVDRNGPQPAQDFPGADDWVEAHDDGLMELFEPFTATLSASWLAVASTDAKLWIEGEDEKLANSFAKEIWKQLTWDHHNPKGGQRSDRQILAGVGIVADDLAQFGELAKETPPPPQPEYNLAMVNVIINKIMLYNPEDLLDNLDMATGDDEGLAVGACQRLGIGFNEGLILKAARRNGAKLEDWVKAVEVGDLLDEEVNYVDLAGANSENASVTTPQPLPPPPPPVGTIKQALQSSVAQGVVPPPPPPPPAPTVTVGAAPATNSGRGGRRPKTPEQAPAGSIPIDVLRSIKEHAGLKDEDFATMLGISRPTLANIMKGKGWCVPNEDRRKALHAMLELHSAKLSEAAAQIIPF